MMIVLLRRTSPSVGVQGPRGREPGTDAGLSFALPFAAVGRVATVVPSSNPQPTRPVAFKVGTTQGSKITFAGSAESTFLVLAALLGAAAVSLQSRSSVVVRKMGRKELQNNWYAKRKKYLLRLRDAPQGVIKKREIKERKKICLYVRRKDMALTRLTTYWDIRNDRFQIPTDEVRSMVENPEYRDPDKLRSRLGLPPPPWDFRKKGLEEMRLSVATRRVQSQNDEKEKKFITKDGREFTPSPAQLAREKKASEAKMDLANLGEEFAEFKGIKITKKKKTPFVSKRKNR